MKSGKTNETGKKIGIRYCGGCNPTYDRMQMVRQLKSRYLNRFCFLLPKRKKLDGLLFINGCPSSCAAKDANPEGPVSFSMTGKDELPLLIHWLATLEEKRSN
jgi:hypothetical protein